MTKKDIAFEPLPMGEEIKLSAAFEQIKAALPEQIAYQAIRAKMNKALFDELVAVGFTVEQAMELVKAKGF